MLRILVTKPGQPDQSNTFDSQEVSIGRAEGNDLVLAEPGISAMHARVIAAGQELILLDLDSTNGTFVNGEKICGPATISAQDEVLICALRLEFSLVSNDQVQTSPSSVNSHIPTNSSPAADAAWPSPAPNFAPADQNQQQRPSEVNSPPAPFAPSVHTNPPANLESNQANRLPPMLGSNPVDAPNPNPPPSRPEPILSQPRGPEHVFPNPNAARPPTMFPAGSMPGSMPASSKLTGSLPPLIGQAMGESGVAQSGITQPPPPIEIPSPGPNEQPVAPQTIPPSTSSAKPSTSNGAIPTKQAPVSSATTPHDFAPLPNEANSPLGSVFSVLANKFPQTEISNDPEFRRRVYQVAEQLLINLGSSGTALDIESVANQMVGELCHFGPITPYLDDPSIKSILIRGPEFIEINRNDQNERLSGRFSCPQALRLVMTRLMKEDLSASNGMNQSTLPNGRTVIAIDQAYVSSGPLCWIGPHHTLFRLTIDQIVEQEMLPRPLANLLRSGIRGRLNLLVCIHPTCGPTPQVLSALMEEASANGQTVVARPNRSVHAPPSTICMDAHGDTMRFIELVRLAKIMDPQYLVLSEISSLAQLELASLLSSIEKGMILCLRAASADAAFQNITNAHQISRSSQANPISEAPIPIDLVLAIGTNANEREMITQLCEVGISQSGQPGLLTLFERNEITGQCAYSEGYPQILNKLRERGVNILENNSF